LISQAGRLVSVLEPIGLMPEAWSKFDSLQAVANEVDAAVPAS
jgi:hypothetical protein